MTARLYTATEVYEMRSDVKRICTAGLDHWSVRGMEDRVEEHLRTYMAGGVDPAGLRDLACTLEAEANQADRAAKAWFASR